jgi:hypothetical protein
MSDIERDIDPPSEDPRNVRIKSWWITIKWDDGRIEDLALPEAFRQAWHKSMVSHKRNIKKKSNT